MSGSAQRYQEKFQRSPLVFSRSRVLRRERKTTGEMPEGKANEPQAPQHRKGIDEEFWTSKHSKQTQIVVNVSGTVSVWMISRVWLCRCPYFCEKLFCSRGGVCCSQENFGGVGVRKREIGHGSSWVGVNKNSTSTFIVDR